MNDDESKTPAPKANPDTKAIPGDRIAKVLARAGVASRREAEKIIEAGRVTVNGKTILTPALNVTGKDRIVVDGKPLAEPEPPRIWLYHKPAGLVTTERDEKGRNTVFKTLPDDMPRVMSVGRLDINSEGLLLLTNDGELKRTMEFPSTGWLRRYRVRINGSLSEAKLDELRAGIEVDGVKYAGVEVKFDRQQGANAWLTMGLREGKNREIRKLMEAMGVVVNRLLRISYGPFQLGTLKPGKVEEVKQRIVRDQMGLRETPKGPMGAKASPKGKRTPPKRGTHASAKKRN
jgi:23S rRNA pseudouridine2605 synthase